MDDFNINPLTNETCNFSKEFLISLLGNSFVPIIDKPTWVYNDTVTSFYNKFISQICIE